MTSEAVPSGKDSAVYGGLLILGVGILLPWNALITAADFFEARYPGRHADRMFSIVYLPTQLLTLLIVTRFHQYFIPISKLRIVLGFCGFSFLMLLVAVTEAVTVAQNAFYGILFVVFAIGVLDGIAQGALYGEFSMLPPRFTQAIVSGTAVSGTAISALRICTKAAFSDTPRGLAFGASDYIVASRKPRSLGQREGLTNENSLSNGDLYFALAAAVCLLCAYVFTFALPRQPLIRLSRLSHPDLAASPQREPGVGSPRAETNQEFTGQAEDDDLREAAAAGLLDNPKGGVSQDRRNLVVRKTWQFLGALIAIYTVTLAIFPGFLVEDINSATLGSWYPILLIAAFNVADLLGKCAPALGTFQKDAGGLTLGCSMSRAAFVPAFYLAARFSGSPALMTLLTLALGASNGYLTSLAMTRAPARVEPPADKNLAGNLSVLALVGGLTLGAACSFLWLL